MSWHKLICFFGFHVFYDCLSKTFNKKDVEWLMGWPLNWTSIEPLSEVGAIGNAAWWKSEPDVPRVASDVQYRVDRLKAIGNGQVPLCAATAFTLLRERLNE
jgi:hypothetical protein